MPKVVIFATVVSKPGVSAEVEEVLTRLVGPSRKEAGCETYELHQDNEEEGTFVFYEIWGSQADVEAHNQSAHFVEAAAKLGALAADVSVLRTTKMGV